MKLKQKMVGLILFYLILFCVSVLIAYLKNRKSNEDSALAVGLRGDVGVTKNLSSFQKEKLKKYFTQTPALPHQANTASQNVVTEVQTINKFNQSQAQ